MIDMDPVAIAINFWRGVRSPIAADHGRLPAAVLVVLLLVAPSAQARRQTGAQSVGQPPSASAPMRALQTAAAVVPDHAVSGVVKSLQPTRLVITRAGKMPAEMTFVLNPETQREGPIAVGVKVQVRFRGEGHSPIATAVLVTPPPKRHSD
jgi:hypothetical protein